MLIDGRGVVLDVAGRTLTAELAADPSSRIVNVDAAVYVAGEDEAPQPRPVPPSAVAPAAVARQIEAASRPPGGTPEMTGNDRPKGG